jgi:hypothetical protein
MNKTSHAHDLGRIRHCSPRIFYTSIGYHCHTFPHKNKGLTNQTKDLQTKQRYLKETRASPHNIIRHMLHNELLSLIYPSKNIYKTDSQLPDIFLLSPPSHIQIPRRLHSLTHPLRKFPKPLCCSNNTISITRHLHIA